MTFIVQCVTEDILNFWTAVISIGQGTIFLEESARITAVMFSSEQNHNFTIYEIPWRNSLMLLFYATVKFENILFSFFFRQESWKMLCHTKYLVHV